jgi:hypothetical protein
MPLSTRNPISRQPGTLEATQAGFVLVFAASLVDVAAGKDEGFLLLHGKSSRVQANSNTDAI